MKNYKLFSKCFCPMAVILGSLVCLFHPNVALAASRLQSGIENITSSFLIPLSRAVAGGSLITFVIMSYFKKEEYQKNIANVFFLAVISSVGLSLIDMVSRNFS